MACTCVSDSTWWICILEYMLISLEMHTFKIVALCWINFWCCSFGNVSRTLQMHLGLVPHLKRSPWKALKMLRSVELTFGAVSSVTFPEHHRYIIGLYDYDTLNTVHEKLQTACDEWLMIYRGSKTRLIKSDDSFILL